MKKVALQVMLCKIEWFYIGQNLLIIFLRKILEEEVCRGHSKYQSDSDNILEQRVYNS